MQAGMKTLRRNQNKMIEIKNIVIEMKIAFHVLISKLDSAQERIIEFEDRSEENSQSEKQR